MQVFKSINQYTSKTINCYKRKNMNPAKLKNYSSIYFLCPETPTSFITVYFELKFQDSEIIFLDKHRQIHDQGKDFPKKHIRV